jgi:hypothetical protein
MLRTRDFALFLGIIAFLVLGISATASRLYSSVPLSASAFLAVQDEPVYIATIPEKETPTRAERISDLKKKLAALPSSLFVAAPINEPVIESSSTTTAATSTENVTPKEQRCLSYRSSTVLWNPIGIVFDEVEGARLIYRSSDSDTASTTERVILAQLPVPSAPLVYANCLSTDVVGIATDGSLIRNNEVGAYSVFGSETLIGYALDGFPIYGVSTQKTDACGGVVVAGQYRYYLASDRDKILYCYAGMPITL